MAKRFDQWILMNVFLVFALLRLSPVSSATDPLDVQVLQDLYRTLYYPSQLIGWNASGGDPCEESWRGISCSSSSVISIKLNGLSLGGSLGGQLFNLLNLKELDISFNHIQGEIPYLLPPNSTHIDFSCNNFSQSLPYTLESMKHLRHINLSRNALSGSIGNVFTGLANLRRMDLSYNSFTGDLPSSFANLSNLTALFLQNNKFTGAVIYLANLHLTDLNIQNNNFSGVVPKQFQYIPNLWIGGNKFQIEGDYPPWDFPLENVSIISNTSGFPTTEANAIRSYPSARVGGRAQKRFSPGGIACTVVGVALVVTGAAAFIAIQINRSRVHRSGSFDNMDSSLPISTIIGYDSSTPEENQSSFPSGSPTMLEMLHPPSVYHSATENVNRRSFSRRTRNPVTAKTYTVGELQLATNNFSEDKLLGEGSLGSVYKADFSNGQIFTIKNINTVALSIHEEEQFLDVVWNVARLRHPNIVTLVGFCLEHGQHLLVYEYVRNLTLEDALHSNVFKYLSWSARIRIALGIARALDYLHSACLPAVAHGNLKAANILLDDELMPRLCDCGLAVLRPLTSNTIKVKASELAISCTGYTAPENSLSGTDKTKSDVYAFGVLLLELLTGRRPFDSSRTREEQSLVKWASSRLHDYSALEVMVDPTTKRMFSSRSLSRFADIVSLCIQPEPEFRPTMAEVVESLVHLVEKSSRDGTDTDIDAFDLSFKTTHTGMLSSPVTSYASV